VGHWCRICGETKPNEKFSGKGHKNYICKQCSSKPKGEIDEIDQKEEIFGYLKQSHISAKNIGRLQYLSTSTNATNADIAKLAVIVLEVAKVRPYKKRRLKILAKERRDLLEQLRETGLIYAHHY